MGHSVMLIEKSDSLGGHVQDWHQLFPNRRPGTEVVQNLTGKLDGNIPLVLNKEIVSIRPFSGKFILTASDGWVVNADAVLVTTGFELLTPQK
jgi:heterodisulfide reductase subunit A-like polyferredoxin